MVGTGGGGVNGAVPVGSAVTAVGEVVGGLTCFGWNGVNKEHPARLIATNRKKKMNKNGLCGMGNC